MKKNLY